MTTDLSVTQAAIAAKCEVLRHAVTFTVAASCPGPPLPPLAERVDRLVAQVGEVGGIFALSPDAAHDIWTMLCSTLLVMRAMVRHPADLAEAAGAEALALKQLLLEKNRKYGNSALEPVRIFSKASPIEQIAVRIDDKIKRIRSMGGLVLVLESRAEDGEDTVQDWVGYMVLARIAIEGHLPAPKVDAASNRYGAIAVGGPQVPTALAPTDPLHPGYWHHRGARGPGS